MSSKTERVLPLSSDLSELLPGSELAQLVAEVPVDAVSGFDVVELTGAAYRQATHCRAVFLRAVAESGMRVPGSVDTVERASHPSEFSSEETRAALVWSRTRAENAFWLGYGLFVQLPVLGEAMLAGVLDEPRAKAFLDWTAGLSDEHAQRVCDELLSAAPSLLVGQLVEKIKRLAIALDPEWAQRQYDEALKGRRVESWQNPDGSANVAGRDLPADRAAAGIDRIDTLARSAKHAGDGRPADAIRADLFLGMMDGQFTGLSDDEIVAYVLAHPLASGEPDGATGETGPAAENDTDAGAAATPRAADAARNDSATGHEGAAGDPARTRPVAQAWAVRELRVELGTLLGLNQHPGELPGLGVIPAGVAVSMAPRMAGGQWRFVLCCSDGFPICSGLTSARPVLGELDGSARAQRAGGGIVELQLTAGQLEQFRRDVAAGHHAAWAAVIRDIARRVDAGSLDLDDSADGAASVDEADLRRRLARAGLRRWVEVRDRYCLHPACRVPAARADQDHRIDYAAGGLTSEDNLDSACRHDHRLIHEGGWATSRVGQDEIVWTSALGHKYVSRPPPVMTIYPEPEPSRVS